MTDDRFRDAPIEIGDDWMAYSEPIPFDPWPNGKPSLAGRVVGMTLGRAVLAFDRWKRAHDRCTRVVLCVRPRVGKHSGCVRHDH